MEAIPEPSGAEPDAVRALILLSGAIAQYGWYRGRCLLRFSSHFMGRGRFLFCHNFKGAIETMQWTGLNELREKFLSFFESKEHLRLPSFPLMPAADEASLLLINS